MDAATKAQRREDYDAIANEPGDWLRDADNLSFAAEALEPCFSIDLSAELDVTLLYRRARLGRPTLMLRGCGLECLFKALFLAKGGALSKDGRYLGLGRREHDLAHLANRAAVALSSPERALVTYLGRFISRGRYPVAKRAADAYLVLTDGTRRGVMWREQDERDYHAIRLRLRQEVVRLTAKA